MTSREFLVTMQEYYGTRYSDAAALRILAYLDGKSEAWRAALLDVTLLCYTGLTPKGERYLPNIAVFESYAAKVLERVGRKNGR